MAVISEYPAEIKTAGDKGQLVELIADSALQKAVVAFNKKNETQYQFVGDEYDILAEDFRETPVVVRNRKAEDLGGKIALYFGVVVNEWDKVYVTEGIKDFVLAKDFTFPQG